jgi:hypothetical protein
MRNGPCRGQGDGQGQQLPRTCYWFGLGINQDVTHISEKVIKTTPFKEIRQKNKNKKSKTQTNDQTNKQTDKQANK